MPKKLNIDQKILYDLYVNKQFSTYKIAKIFNTYDTTIGKYIKEYNIPLRSLKESRNLQNNIWTNQEDDILKKYYGKLTVKEISNQFLTNRTIGSIMSRANKVLNMTRNDNRYDRLFFSTINNINSYIAGIIAADGCIFEHKKSKTKYLSIVFKEIDRYFLNHITQILEYSGNCKEEILNNKKYYRLRIGGIQEDWYKDLQKNFSIGERKSLVLKSPNISNMTNKLYYILGYLYGDGCIYKNNKILKISFIGTKELLDWIYLSLKEQINISNKEYKKKIYKKTTKNTYELCYCGLECNELVKIFLKLDVPFHMLRKYNKMAQINNE